MQVQPLRSNFHRRVFLASALTGVAVIAGALLRNPAWLLGLTSISFGLSRRLELAPGDFASDSLAPDMLFALGIAAIAISANEVARLGGVANYFLLGAIGVTLILAHLWIAANVQARRQEPS